MSRKYPSMQDELEARKAAGDYGDLSEYSDRLYHNEPEWAKTSREDYRRSQKITNNGASPVYAVLSVTGIPAAGEEKAQQAGLSMEIRYVDDKGAAVDVASLERGRIFKAVAVVSNKSGVAVKRSRMKGCTRRASATLPASPTRTSAMTGSTASSTWPPARACPSP